MLEQFKEILNELKEIKIDVVQVKTNTESHKEQLKKLTDDTNLNNNFRNFCMGTIKVITVLIIPIILILIGTLFGSAK